MLSIDFFLSLVQGYWYLGIFLLGFLSSVTLFLPTPAFIVVFLLAKTFDPLSLGIVAGLGAAVGELTGYVVGYGGKTYLLKKYKKQLKGMQKSFQKYGAPFIIFIFAATPLPFDVVGIFCGTISYPWKKFFTATLLGKLVKYIFIAFAGYYGMTWVSRMFGFG
jgi:membrane protein YqaA with SNARE-associated domain